MTKADLIDEVSKLSSLTKKETETIVNTVFDNITEALAKGDKVELRGFGSFRIRHRNSRKGRNPKTGSRSEEHTSELQSRGHLVCRLLLEKKKSRDDVAAVGADGHHIHDLERRYCGNDKRGS